MSEFDIPHLMTDVSLQHRRNRLKFRSWRRGFKELDLILGPWADANIAGLSSEELDAYEALLTAPDWDVYYWITQNQTPDAPHCTQLVQKLVTYIEKDSARKLNDDHDLQK